MLSVRPGRAHRVAVQRRLHSGLVVDNIVYAVESGDAAEHSTDWVVLIRKRACQLVSRLHDRQVVVLEHGHSDDRHDSVGDSDAVDVGRIHEGNVHDQVCERTRDTAGRVHRGDISVRSADKQSRCNCK